MIAVNSRVTLLTLTEQSPLDNLPLATSKSPIVGLTLHVIGTFVVAAAFVSRRELPDHVLDGLGWSIHLVGDPADATTSDPPVKELVVLGSGPVLTVTLQVAPLDLELLLLSKPL
jgi:hypothetical protein